MLFRYSLFTACLTLFLIAAGGLVTSTGAGLSVPDWPLSYGTLFPPMVGNIRFEHSHRLIAGFTGLCTLALSIWLWRAEKRKWLRALGVAASLAVLLQALLGGLTVKFLLPTAVSVAHACLGQSFFVLLCLIAYFQSREWRAPVPATSARSEHFFRLACTTAAFAYAQLVAGAIVRHTHGGGLVAHLFLALMILVHALFLNIHAFKEPSIGRRFVSHLALLDGLLVCQIFLGLGSYILKYAVERGPVPRISEVLFATAHQTTGAAILASLFVLCFRIRRVFAPQREPSAGAEFLELMKPRLTLTALVTTVVGYVLASPAMTDPTRLFHTLLGAFCVGGGGNALNQFLERGTDLKMPRTANRPLPAGRLAPWQALAFGALVSAAGLLELFVFVSPAAGAVGAAIFVSYVFVYTPLKRRTRLNTYVGAVPGALPSLLGWVAAGGGLTAGAASLFLILFLWQLPHFYAIAWVYREDYEKGGLRMMPAADPDGTETAFQIVLFCLLLFAASLVPVTVGLSGPFYLFAATAAGSVFVWLSFELRRRRLDGAKRFVTASIAYLFVIMISLVAGR